MKKIIFLFIGLLMLSAIPVTMTSCLQYDEPGDEFEDFTFKLDTAGQTSAKQQAPDAGWPE